MVQPWMIKLAKRLPFMQDVPCYLCMQDLWKEKKSESDSASDNTIMVTNRFFSSESTNPFLNVEFFPLVCSLSKMGMNTSQHPYFITPKEASLDEYLELCTYFQVTYGAYCELHKGYNMKKVDHLINALRSIDTGDIPILDRSGLVKSTNYVIDILSSGHVNINKDMIMCNKVMMIPIPGGGWTIDIREAVRKLVTNNHAIIRFNGAPLQRGKQLVIRLCKSSEDIGQLRSECDAEQKVGAAIFTITGRTTQHSALMAEKLGQSLNNLLVLPNHAEDATHHLGRICRENNNSACCFVIIVNGLTAVKEYPGHHLSTAVPNFLIQRLQDNYPFTRRLGVWQNHPDNKQVSAPDNTSTDARFNMPTKEQMEAIVAGPDFQAEIDQAAGCITAPAKPITGVDEELIMSVEELDLATTFGRAKVVCTGILSTELAVLRKCMIGLGASELSNYVSSDIGILILKKMHPPTIKEVGVANLIAQGNEIIVIDADSFGEFAKSYKASDDEPNGQPQMYSSVKRKAVDANEEERQPTKRSLKPSAFEVNQSSTTTRIESVLEGDRLAVGEEQSQPTEHDLEIARLTMEMMENAKAITKNKNDRIAKEEEIAMSALGEQERMATVVKPVVLPNPRKREALQDVTNTHDDSGGSIQFQAPGSITFNARLKFDDSHPNVEMDGSVKVPKAVKINRLDDIITSSKTQEIRHARLSLERDDSNMNSFKSFVKSNDRSGVVPWGKVGKRTWMFLISPHYRKKCKYFTEKSSLYQSKSVYALFVTQSKE